MAKHCFHGQNVGQETMDMMDAMMTLLFSFRPGKNASDVQRYTAVVRAIQQKHQQFLTAKRHSKLLASYYAIVANHLLKDQWAEARNTMQLASNLEFILAVSIESGIYIRNCHHKTHKRHEKALVSIDSLEPWLFVVEKTRTRQGLITEAAKKIPCGCLSRKQKDVRKEAATMCCFYCLNDYSQEKMYLCSRCRLASYCSRECQRKDYEFEHRQVCDQYVVDVV